MMITPDCTIAAIATDAPATIRIFQEHEIDFCCGGKVALKEVCANRGLDLDALLVDLRAAASPAPAEPTWDGASLAALVQHIQARYHEPLRKELPRLEAMLDKVVSRHGTHLPEVLAPLQQTFKQLQQDLLAHMAKEDRVLFPFIVALEAGGPLPVSDPAWIDRPFPQWKPSTRMPARRSRAFGRPRLASRRRIGPARHSADSTTGWRSSKPTCTCMCISRTTSFFPRPRGWPGVRS